MAQGRTDFRTAASLVNAACVAVAAHLAAAADPWPQWRGPDGQGHAVEAHDLPVTWSEQEHVRWKTPLPGRGWSSPVIGGGMAWMTTAVEQPVGAEERKRRLEDNTGHQPLNVSGPVSLRALGVDMQSGRLVHDVELFSVADPQPIHALNSYASPSPVLAGDRLYCHFGDFGTACLDTETARVVWTSRELRLNHENGPSSTPVLWKDRLIVHVDGSDTQSIAAFDAATGTIAWQTPRSGTLRDDPQLKKAYGTPLVLSLGGRDVVVSPAADWIYGYDPATGKELWKRAYGELGFSIVPRPVFAHGLLFMSTSFMQPELLALRLGDGTAAPEIAWREKKAVTTMPSPLVVSDELYMVSDKGIATCLDARTGQSVWAERLAGNFSSSPLFADGRIYVGSREGKTYVLRPGRQAEVLATNELDGAIFATPAAVGRALFLRTEHALYRIEKPGPRAAGPPVPGMPTGEVLAFEFAASTIFPGTVREVQVYVPAQYDGRTPACVHVNQDGIHFNAPQVFDRLIHEGRMPVTIGVFVKPGRVPAAREGALDRFNRSFEYDGLGPDYARFLLDELLPAVEKLSTADGRRIVLSKHGNDRSIGGISSGAIAAFTAAWERPDAFSRVFSGIGTYVGLRGGHAYATLVRQVEPKPLRIFLEDGSNDLNIYAGDWWMANQALERSLSFAGYEVRHAWSEGKHDSTRPTEVFPEAMEWLWSDWPKPVAKGQGSPQLQEILLPGEDWRLVGEGYRFTEGPAANARGEVFFNDVGAGKTYRLTPDWKPEVWLDDSHKGDGQAFAPDGRLVAASAADQALLAWDAEKRPTVLAKGWRGNDVVVTAAGRIYATEPGWDGKTPSRIHCIDAAGTDTVVDEGLKFSNGLCLSPDQTLLYVADSRSHWVWSFTIQADGSLTNKQRYFHLHVPDTADDAGADGMRVDRDGRLWVATRMGIQVCDQLGRVNCIIPTPNGKCANLCFGGPEFDHLIAACGDKVFVRKVKPRGAANFLPPVTPAKPKL
jgi:sugar lactone lactonase YvrE/outer membrane protein assembly factor BamB/enterochelin esterase-like enzyme